MCHTACYLVVELLDGNNGDPDQLVLGGVGIAAQVRVVFLNDDLCHSIYSLGVNALHVDRSLVKEQYGFFFFNLL